MNREEKKLRKHFAQHALGLAVRKQRQKETRMRRAMETAPVRERVDPLDLDGWEERDLPPREPMKPRARENAVPAGESRRPAAAGAWMYDGVALGLAGDRLRVWRRGEVQLASAAGHRFAEPLAPGDEVALEERSGSLCLAAVAPRRSRLVRPDPHVAARPRVLAANVDVVIAVMPAGPRPPRPGLVDRILLAAARCEVEAWVCLSKLDLTGPGEVERFLAPFRELSTCFACSALTGAGIEALRERLRGRRAVLVGHSGGGKSSLANALRPGSALPTGPLREHDGRGRHTTSAAAMVELPGGGQLLDTPGVRQFGFWAIGRADLLRHFADIARLARDCRFRNCRHRDEPDCAVVAAVASGELVAARWAAFQRLEAEVWRE